MTAGEIRSIADILVLRAGNGERMLTYRHRRAPSKSVDAAELLVRAQRVAAILRSRGVSPGDRVLLMLTSQSDFVDAFFGTVWADAVPVPLFPPVFARQPEDFAANFVRIAANSGAKTLVVAEEIIGMVGAFATALGNDFRILPPVAAGTDSERLTEAPARKRDDLAVLQYTSGSTGSPKGVALSHTNILTNVRAIGDAISLDVDDVGVSWLPLYHDMGLIGVLATLYHGGRAVLMSPLDFAKEPASWLRAISECGGTLSPAPNFAFRLCLRIADAQLDGLDLSTWRVAFNGSEPIDADTARGFIARFRPYGFRPSALFPVYGLAEHTLAVSFPPLDHELRIDTVDRGRLTAYGIADSVPADAQDTMSFVCVGAPLQGVIVEIRDDHGTPLPECRIGEVTVSSASVMSGYFGDVEATAEVLSDGWLKTGDLGYLKSGMLYITGRIKDLIIRAGRNYYPDDLESAAAGANGVRSGRVAAFSVPAEDGAEHVVVLAESDPAGRRSHAELKHQIASTIAERVGFRPERVELLARGTLPVTSSGKVRRRAARERFLSGALGGR